MKKQISTFCEICKSQENAVCQRGFLGFENCTCSKCGTLTKKPLSRGYRVTYWILGIIFALVLLVKIPILLSALNVSLYMFFLKILEQWVFILFVVGVIIALKRDAVMRRKSPVRADSNNIE